MCRGCRFHLMLRPAFLLPPADGRLSTPRSGHRDLSLCLGPATRRSDAYRGGTLTRWRSAARRHPPFRTIVFVTTHHVGNLPRWLDSRWPLGYRHRMRLRPVLLVLALAACDSS